mmetsp:Transcript_35111/g.110969  ORF Transcript_35111/g.110969 Transcript_35111/m.110969 type:complete len:233 (+) Transcript_35111:152-850(+)
MMSISLLASQGRAVPCPRRLAPHARASSAQPSGGARRAPWALGIRTGPDAPAKSSARPGRGSLVMCSSSGRLGLKRSDPTADDAAEDYAAPGELTASIAAAPPPPRPRAAGGEVLSVNVSVGTALLALSLTALAGTGAAVASFMVFIRPAVKAMEEASISANKASKEVEKRCPSSFKTLNPKPTPRWRKCPSLCRRTCRSLSPAWSRPRSTSPRPCLHGRKRARTPPPSFKG